MQATSLIAATSRVYVGLELEAHWKSRKGKKSRQGQQQLVNHAVKKAIGKVLRMALLMAIQFSKAFRSLPTETDAESLSP